MKTRYLLELERLNEAYRVAVQADIVPLSRAVEQWLDRPMVMVGSGGSFSTASFAAYLHEHYSGNLARAATPLEIISNGNLNCGAACFSASGRNRDIGLAFKSAAIFEMTPLSVLVMAEATPLHDLAARYRYSDVVGYADPHYRDGFLAVASLVGSSVLLLRAYRGALGNGDAIPASLEDLIASVASVDRIGDVAEASDAIVGRASLSVLFSPSLKPASVDLESRFVEAALGALHAADLRNFGHGRHHWLAKHANETGVLALVGQNEAPLASRTLELLPSETPVYRVDFTGAMDLQALAGLVVGLHVSEAAGRAAGLDPGKPGVPDFGRRLYRLGPGSIRRQAKTVNREAALKRKRVHAGIARATDESAWIDAYEAALDRINACRFGGIVFDYDGTLCDHRARFEPMSEDAADALLRVLGEGALVGVATGRGPSAGAALRRRLPKSIWPRILIGYYNGAVITDLSDERDPIVDDRTDEELLKALQLDDLFASRTVRANEKQISITLASPAEARHSVGVATSLVKACGRTAQVLASSHSIDIIIGDASKLRVVDALRRKSVDPLASILRIGDKGVWPGNDSDLLDDPLGLTVDEASPHRMHCWGLAPAGVKGLHAALYYLDCITWSDFRGRIKIAPEARAARR